MRILAAWARGPYALRGKGTRMDRIIGEAENARLKAEERAQRAEVELAGWKRWSKGVLLYYALNVGIAWGVAWFWAWKSGDLNTAATYTYERLRATVHDLQDCEARAAAEGLGPIENDQRLALEDPPLPGNWSCTCSVTPP